MSDIFVSYASADRERVRPLVRRIEEYGWSAWWDREIPAGSRWEQVIEQALGACRAMVVVWTTGSVASKWVMIEASEGEEQGWLVPVRFDQVTVPLRFKGLQTADLSDWDGSNLHPGFRTMVEALESKTRPGELTPRPRPADPNSLLALSLLLRSDLGSRDPRDLMWLDSEVQKIGREAAPLLMTALEASNPAKRGHAAYLLGFTREPAVVPALAALLNDSSEVGLVAWLPTVGAAAEIALKRIGSPEALLALAERQA